MIKPSIRIMRTRISTDYRVTLDDETFKKSYRHKDFNQLERRLYGEIFNKNYMGIRISTN